MSINEYRPIVLGRQFIFKENEEGEMILSTITRKDSLGNDVTDYEVYELYPEGRKYIGSFGFVGQFWNEPFYRLVENTRYSVTFYSESYTRSMMLDWVESNMASMMIAYSRVYKVFKKDKNIDDNPTGYSYRTISNSSVSSKSSEWYKTMFYKTGSEGEIDITTSTDIRPPTLCYPFIIQKCPLLLQYAANMSINQTIKFKNKIELQGRPGSTSYDYRSYQDHAFPNVEIDKLNLLLPKVSPNP